MNKYKQPAAVFVTLIAIAMFIAWMGGYNFDYRNSDVGFFTALTLFISIGIPVSIYFNQEL